MCWVADSGVSKKPSLMIKVTEYRRFDTLKATRTEPLPNPKGRKWLVTWPIFPPSGGFGDSDGSVGAEFRLSDSCFMTD